MKTAVRLNKVGGERRTRELIGDTPLVDLSFLSAKPGVKIFGKAEFFNPSGSIKDRIANHIISCAEAEGKLRPGGTVVAATSGNTGSAIAMVCAMRGYKYIVITNEKTSKEKRDSMASYGGQVLVGPGGMPADHPLHYQNMAVTLCKENPDYFDVDQYDNPRNPEAYYLTLGPEIWEQTQGAVTHFVAGGSTGGTISGTGKYLKEMNPAVRVCMPDPKGSVFWDYWKEGVPEAELKPSSYQVEGVGKDSIPTAMNFGVVDEMLQLDCKQSFAMCRRVAAEDGMLLGGSSGLNLSAAAELSQTAPDGSVIVAVLPDSGVKYLSKIFNDEWMMEKGFMEAPPAKVPRKPLPTDTTGASMSPAQLEKFLGGVSDTLVKYVASGGDRSKKVVELASPEEIAAAFDKAGASLALADEEGAAGEAALHKALDATLEYSVRTHHPNFFNQLYGAVDPMGVAADWAAVAANTNVHTFEVAPVFTVVEREVLSKMARCVGGPFAEQHDGLFVPGGSIANTYAMHLARTRAFPDAATKGAAAGPRLVAFTSEQSHYSYKKAAMLTGLGSDNLVAVPCDETGGMLPDALDAAMKAAAADGAVPFFVGATAGTTVTGAFDPFNTIADVCERHGAYMHVDGAWGAATLLSSKPEVRGLMAGAERADSLAWNAHKLMGAPLQCSAFITRHPGALQATCSTKAAYLFQPDKLYAEYDLGDKTIQCGRRADAFKLWFAWKALGDAGWSRRVDHCVELAVHFEHRLAASGGEFVLAKPRTYANVCFWYVPPSMRPWNPATASDEDKAAMGRVAVEIKAEMQRRGLAMIGFQPLDDLPNFFRIVFPSGINTSKADLDKLLASIAEIGEKL